MRHIILSKKHYNNIEIQNDIKILLVIYHYINKQMKTYTISLDSKPYDRWTKVICDHKIQIIKIYEQLENLHSTVFANLLGHVINLGSYMDKIMYKEELQYISDETKIPFEKVVLLQLLYELSAACTSVIYCDGDVPIHIRTMDWPLDELKNMTIQVNFTRNNKIVYSGISWAGYVGLMTAMKPNICSISLNYRQCDGSILSNIKNLIGLKWPSGYLIRDALENSNDYDTIHTRLINTHLIAPSYFIICGISKEQCFTIVRDRDSYKEYPLTTYIAQTNIDPDVSMPKNNILLSVERKQKIEEIMNKVDLYKSNTIDDMVKQFKVYPVINDETIYLTIMIPKVDYISSEIV
jgi:N-acylethanolamine-hydrolysing acid amidase